VEVELNLRKKAEEQEKRNYNPGGVELSRFNTIAYLRLAWQIHCNLISDT